MGGQPQGGVVTPAAGLVGVLAAPLHGEFLQPRGIGTLIPNGGK